MISDRATIIILVILVIILPLFAYILGQETITAQVENQIRRDQRRLLTAHRDGVLTVPHASHPISQEEQPVRIRTGGDLDVYPRLALIKGAAGVGDTGEALARARHPAGKAGSYDQYI
jgi:hypothetical protein